MLRRGVCMILRMVRPLYCSSRPSAVFELLEVKLVECVQRLAEGNTEREGEAALSSYTTNPL